MEIAMRGIGEGDEIAVEHKRREDGT